MRRISDIDVEGHTAVTAITSPPHTVRGGSRSQIETRDPLASLGHSADASGGSFSRSAERYWLLRFEDQELRFTLREAADRWVADLRESGIAYELSRHDEEVAIEDREPNRREMASEPSPPFERNGCQVAGADGRERWMRQNQVGRIHSKRGPSPAGSDGVIQ